MIALPTEALTDGIQQPIASGILLGLLMIGPEHLGTLMALSTLTSGMESFRVGMSWGVGHSIGMVAIIPPFLVIERLSRESMDVTVGQWEYWGDYFIGASLIAVGIYFFVNENKYLEQQADGTYECRACCNEGYHGHHGHHDHDVQECEKSPLLQDSAVALSRPSGSVSAWVSWETTLLGVFQGLCCPMALMGIGFIGKMSSATIPNLVIFSITFLLASSLGSGVLTLCWGLLTSHGIASCISPLVVFRVANFITFAVGVVWIAANASGTLHRMDMGHMNHSMTMDMGMSDRS